MNRTLFLIVEEIGFCCLVILNLNRLRLCNKICSRNSIAVLGNGISTYRDLLSKVGLAVSIGCSCSADLSATIRCTGKNELDSLNIQIAFGTLENVDRTFFFLVEELGFRGFIVINGYFLRCCSQICKVYGSSVLGNSVSTNWQFSKCSITVFISCCSSVNCSSAFRCSGQIELNVCDVLVALGAFHNVNGPLLLLIEEVGCCCLVIFNLNRLRLCNKICSRNSISVLGNCVCTYRNVCKTCLTACICCYTLVDLSAAVRCTGKSEPDISYIQVSFGTLYDCNITFLFFIEEIFVSLIIIGNCYALFCSGKISIRNSAFVLVNSISTYRDLISEVGLAVSISNSFDSNFSSAIRCTRENELDSFNVQIALCALVNKYPAFFFFVKEVSFCCFIVFNSNVLLVCFQIRKMQ